MDALERAFGAHERPVAPLRTHLEIPGGELLLMPAAGEEGAGVKLVTIAPKNPARGLPLVQAAYVLIEAGTLAPRAVVDGAALTALRTAAVSALATRHLARPDAEHLVLFGAGVQARSHLEAMAAVRPLRWVRVVGRSPEPVERLVEHARGLGLDAAPGEPEDVAHAELVCTCTTSSEPVFPGSRLAAGAHVNAVGAYRPDMRELDDAAMTRGRVVVETREAALAEAGDLLLPMGRGVRVDIAADLGEVVRGAVVRRSGADVTVFKSVGVAFEDLAVARAAVERL